MDWYYVSANEEQGPVEQAEFEQLVHDGVITDSTLVWAEGMMNWQPYSQVALSASAPSPGNPSPGVVCSECGRAFAADQVIRLGSGFVCAACKPLAVQKLREGVPDSNAELVRKDHIKHEASVKSIGILYYLGAGLLLLSGAVMFVASMVGSGHMGSAVGIGVFFLGVGGLQLWAGFGLRQLKPSARVGAGILSGIGLLGFPMGTLINGYILYLLFSSKGAMVFSDEYKQIIEQTPHVKYRTPIVVWILLGLFLALIGAVAVAVILAPHRPLH